MTMQDIMDEAKVSRGALYAYFDHIEHVFMEVLQLDDREIIHLFEPSENSSVWKHIKRWVEQQHQHIIEIEQSLLLARAEFFLAVRNKKTYPYITERYENTVQVITAAIQHGVEQGELKPQLPSASIALYLVSFLDGLMLNTFQLGAEKTKVGKQLDALLFSLETMLCPVERKRG